MDSIVQGDWLIKKLPCRCSRSADALDRRQREFGFSFLAVFAILRPSRPEWTVHCLVPAAGCGSLVRPGAGDRPAGGPLFAFFRDLRHRQMGLMFAFFSAPILFKRTCSPLVPPRRLSSPGTRPYAHLAALFQKRSIARRLAQHSGLAGVFTDAVRPGLGVATVNAVKAAFLLLCLTVCSAASKTLSGRACARFRLVAGEPAQPWSGGKDRGRVFG